MPVVFSNTATIGRHHSSCTLQYTTNSLPAAKAPEDKVPTIAMANESAVRVKVVMFASCKYP